MEINCVWARETFWVMRQILFNFLPEYSYKLRNWSQILERQTIFPYGTSPNASHTFLIMEVYRSHTAAHYIW
jgi:hypothetical protein